MNKQRNAMSIALRFLAVVLTLTFVEIAQGQVLPNQCPMNCYCKDMVVECMSLMEFPMTFPTDTKSIKLSQMNVRDIPPNAFSYMPQLEMIEFNNCNVQSLQGCSFSEMPSIMTIKLEKTVIENIQSYAFRGLRNLKKFEIISSRIGRVKPFAFYNLHDFSFFSIFDTHIQNIYNSAFYNITRLSRFTASRGNFSDIVTGAFRHMKEVGSLEMHMNTFWNMQCMILEDLMASTTSLIFVENMFYCNCSIFHFVNSIGRVKFQTMIEKNRCQGPTQFANRSTLWHILPVELKCGPEYQDDQDRPCQKTMIQPKPECPKLEDGVFVQPEDEMKKDVESSGVGLKFDVYFGASVILSWLILRRKELI